MSTRNPQFTPGDPVAVADLVKGDTLYARQDRDTKAPTAPVEVVHVAPPSKRTGLILVTVQSLYQRQSPWALGYLSATKTFPRAVVIVEG